MTRLIFRCAAALLLASTSLAAQDAVAVWTALEQPAFDASKTATLNGLTIARDRIKLTFTSGTIQFSQPVNGRAFGAVFAGEGRVQVAAPNAIEARQMWVFSGLQTLDLGFTEAVFTFSDHFMDEVGAAAQWSSNPAFSTSAYLERQKHREEYGGELLPRLYKAMLSADPKRTALFAADLKTKDKGWIHVRFDALKPEEILAGKWNNWGSRAGGVERLDAWLNFPAGNRSVNAAFNDPLEREDFQIRNYVLDVALNQAAELTATAKVGITQRSAGQRVLLFLFDSNLRVSAVTNDKGETLPFFQPRDPKDRNQPFGDYLAVVLPQPTAPGTEQRLEFKYAGKRVVRREGNGNFFCQSYGWYPTRPNSFATRADFEMTFKIPKRFTLVATGSKLSETTDGDVTTSAWKNDIPLAVAGFAFGDYKIHTETVGQIEVAVYANRLADSVLSGIQKEIEGTAGGPRLMGPGSVGASAGAVGELTPARLAKSMAIEVGNTLRVFEQYFGPYPYKRLVVSSLPVLYSYGQGWPNLVYLWSLSFLDSQQRHTLGVVDHTGLTDFFRAHEASHQWWGHRVGWKSYHDQWLSEGFAQFSGNLYVQFRQGDKEYLNRLRLDKMDLKYGDYKNRRYESIGPVWMGTRLDTADGPGTYAAVVYAKGGYILHMIRMMLLNPTSPDRQDERFIKLMREFCQTYDNRAASTEDFKAVLEKHMLRPLMDIEGNGKMDWFFRQYVYGTGIPEYEFKYTISNAADGKAQINATITRLGGPDLWLDLLPIYMQRGDRTVRLGLATVRERVTNVNFTLPSRPEKLILNANEDMLAEIKQ